MTPILERSSRFLHGPVGVWPRLLLGGAAVLLVTAQFLPLWNLTMFAPQYAHGLELNIHSSTLVGGHGGQDIKEINLLNHYIGMHDLAVEDFTEFKWMPFVLGGLALLFLRAVVLGTVKELVDSSWSSATSAHSPSGRSHTRCTGTGTTCRRRRPSRSRRSRRPSSATSRSPTSRCTPTRRPAPMCSSRSRCSCCAALWIAWLQWNRQSRQVQ